MCVGVMLRSHTLRRTVGKRHSHDFGGKATELTVGGEQGDKIFWRVVGDTVVGAVINSPDVLLIRSSAWLKNWSEGESGAFRKSMK